MIGDMYVRALGVRGGGGTLGRSTWAPGMTVWLFTWWDLWMDLIDIWWGVRFKVG